MFLKLTLILICFLKWELQLVPMGLYDECDYVQLFVSQREKIEKHQAGYFSKENQKSYKIKKEKKEKKSFDDTINRQESHLFQMFLEWNT